MSISFRRSFQSKITNPIWFDQPQFIVQCPLFWRWLLWIGPIGRYETCPTSAPNRLVFWDEFFYLVCNNWYQANSKWWPTEWWSRRASHDQRGHDQWELGVVTHRVVVWERQPWLTSALALKEGRMLWIRPLVRYKTCPTSVTWPNGLSHLIG